MTYNQYKGYSKELTNDYYDLTENFTDEDWEKFWKKCHISTILETTMKSIERKIESRKRGERTN